MSSGARLAAVLRVSPVAFKGGWQGHRPFPRTLALTLARARTRVRAAAAGAEVKRRRRGLPVHKFEARKDVDGWQEIAKKCTKQLRHSARERRWDVANGQHRKLRAWPHDFVASRTANVWKSRPAIDKRCERLLLFTFKSRTLGGWRVQSRE